MSFVRRAARPLLATAFVSGGVSVLRDPDARVERAKPMLEPLAQRAGDAGLPSDPRQLVQLNAALMVGAGGLLALGKTPRLAALALAGSLVPTTLGGHRFWEEEDPQRRAAERTAFIKNVSILGGLLLATVDTGGRPSVGWQAKRAARKAAGRTTAAIDDARRSAEDVVESAIRSAEDAVDSARKGADAVVGSARSLRVPRPARPRRAVRRQSFGERVGKAALAVGAATVADAASHRFHEAIDRVEPHLQGAIDRVETYVPKRR